MNKVTDDSVLQDNLVGEDVHREALIKMAPVCAVC